MKVRVIGGGWYGCHIALALLRDGHDVELHEEALCLFAGASGNNPARLHQGFHYPRSRLTRAACLEHTELFMSEYGGLTYAVPTNLYAVARHDSVVDFGTYRQVLAGEVEFVTVRDPARDFGLTNVEGALLTGERHIRINEARKLFTAALNGSAHFAVEPTELVDDPAWDLTVDCTFCSHDAEAIDRYEPCLVPLLEGPTDRAVTIMDGPFPSIYPWDEGLGLCSLSSARWTPLSKECRTYGAALELLNRTSRAELTARAEEMRLQMARFWPASLDMFRLAELRTSIRAMPKSGADARLVDIVRVGERALRVRAGKIDAVFRAEHLIKETIACWPSRGSAPA